MLMALGMTPEQCAALDKPIESFGFVEVDPATGEQRLTERVASQLTPDVAEYVLALATRGLEDRARAIANCYQMGMVSAHCHRRDHARGYRWRCKEKGCEHCGHPKVQLAVWLRPRDLKKVASEPQIGMQLSLNIFDGEAREDRAEATGVQSPPSGSSDPDQTLVRAWDARLAFQTIKRLGDAFRRLARKVKFDYLAVDEIDHRGFLVGIRLVCRLGHADVRAIARAWHEIEPNSLCRLYVHSDPLQVLFWAFSGLGKIRQIEPEKRVEFTKLYKGDHSVRTSRAFYARLSGEECQVMDSAHNGHSDSEQCPCCFVRGRLSEMEEIPSGQRRIETVGSILTRYKTVEWEGGRRVDLRRLSTCF